MAFLCDEYSDIILFVFNSFFKSCRFPSKFVYLFSMYYDLIVPALLLICDNFVAYISLAF